MSFGLKKYGRMAVKRGKAIMNGAPTIRNGYITDTLTTLISHSHMATTMRKQGSLQHLSIAKELYKS